MMRVFGLAPAAKIIDIFGGEREVAKITGISLTSVYRWEYPPEKRGYGGRVPEKHIHRLVEAARERGFESKIRQILANPPHLVERELGVCQDGVSRLMLMAIKMFGTQVKLAKAAGVSQAVINEAKKTGRVGPRLAIGLERATKGEIRRHQLRPDLWEEETPEWLQ